MRVIKLQGLSREQVQQISAQIAEAFYDYKYNEDDTGLIKYIPTGEAMFIYIDAIFQAAYKPAYFIQHQNIRKGI